MVDPLAYGTDPNDPKDAALDADGDGLSNLTEFLAGTDPRDPASALRIISLRLSGISLTVQISTVQGKRYALEATDDLRSGQWTVVDRGLVGNGGLLETTVPAPPKANSFYRLRLLQ